MSHPTNPIDPHWEPVRIAALLPPVRIGVDLFMVTARDRRPRLYSGSQRPPSGDDLERLLVNGIHRLYVRSDQLAMLRAQLSEMLNSGVDIPAGVRLEMLREVVKADFALAWRASSAAAMIAQTARFARQVVDICHDRSEMTTALASLAQHDGDTFHHISNVCVYAVMLAQALGMSDERKLLEVGQAALLHDLGKRGVRADILQKPGKLTAAEREAISDHPRLGFLELCHDSNLTRDQLLTVYQHHERLDGSGYPVRLVGNEINWLAQLCAVVDVFEALTGTRPYRRAAPAEEAIETLQRAGGRHYNEEYLQCWTKLVGNSTLVRV